MGDRSNIAIINGETLYCIFYGHWMGEDYKRILKGAIDRGERWDDPAYFAAIVARELFRDNLEESTGIGISQTICDNEHPILVADCSTQLVYFVEEKDFVRNEILPVNAIGGWTATFKDIKESGFPVSTDL